MTKCRLVLFFLAINVSGSSVAQTASLDAIVSEIQRFESRNDPKCYATASRLEDFMFGTPLEFDARSKKNDLQKELISTVWQTASLSTEASTLNADDILSAASAFLTYEQQPSGHWQVKFADEVLIAINGTDKRQYSSVAYSLRALLAAQQDAILSDYRRLKLLSPEAINTLKDISDLFTLSVLKVSDTYARSNNLSTINESILTRYWHELLSGSSIVTVPSDRTPALSEPVQVASTTDLTLAVIKQKVAAYAEYNAISNSLFVRNLQVYFAKRRWPEDSEEANKFRQDFTEALIDEAADFYLGSQRLASQRGAKLIKDLDVHTYVQTRMPHKANEYEDIIFFPALRQTDRVTIEAYDIDAFRDSGIHWRYLEFALQEHAADISLECDPFCLELLTESIANMGVLLLRLAGEAGIETQRERLLGSDIAYAKNRLAALRRQHNTQPTSDSVSKSVSSISSRRKLDTFPNGDWFSDITQASGVVFMHRSSDWLNRQLRSYLRKDENTGVITIPPAFGGGGIAVGDIDNDGDDDVLLVGGLGNKLYQNNGHGQFSDVTQAIGLDWRRSDGTAGEPRQPIIADMDNDGWQDIIITYVNDTHRIYRNLGEGQFEDVSDRASLGGVGLVGGPATVFDYDDDGLLDIYITYFGNYLNGVLPTLARRNANGGINQLFRNKGGFRFENAGAQVGLSNTGWAQAVTHTDFNGDGKTDVIVGNDFGVNAYYQNTGESAFEEVSMTIGTQKPSYTMGIGLADLNDDLRPDIYISNIVTMNKDQKYVLPDESTQMIFDPDKLANMRVVEANDLFISSVTPDTVHYRLSNVVDRGYSATGWSWGAIFFDADHDGDEDLYVSNGMNEFNLYSSENPYYTDPLENNRLDIHLPSAGRDKNVFFLNDAGRFNNRSGESGLDLLGNSRAVVASDIDADGDLDIILNNYHEAAHVYQNNLEDGENGWVKIQLRGAPDQGVNRDAIGAQVILTTDDGNSIWRELRGSSGYMTGESKTLHFGLGTASVSHLIIRWPNGKSQRVDGLSTRKTHLIPYAPK